MGCDTTCTVTATATATPAAAPPRKQRRVTVALATVKLTLGAGDTKIVRPTLSQANARRLVKALRGRRGLEVNVQIAATGDDGRAGAGDQAGQRDALSSSAWRLAPLRGQRLIEGSVSRRW